MLLTNHSEFIAFNGRYKATKQDFIIATLNVHETNKILSS